MAGCRTYEGHAFPLVFLQHKASRTFCALRSLALDNQGQLLFLCLGTNQSSRNFCSFPTWHLAIASSYQFFQPSPKTAVLVFFSYSQPPNTVFCPVEEPNCGAGVGSCGSPIVMRVWAACVIVAGLAPDDVFAGVIGCAAKPPPGGGGGMAKWLAPANDIPTRQEFRHPRSYSASAPLAIPS
jgi:hypothetical protein